MKQNTWHEYSVFSGSQDWAHAKSDIIMRNNRKQLFIHFIITYYICISEQSAVAAISNRFPHFVSGGLNPLTPFPFSPPHTVIIALPQFSRYFVTFAPPGPFHNREKSGSTKHRRKTDGKCGIGNGMELEAKRDLWRGRIDSIGSQMKYSTGYVEQ